MSILFQSSFAQSFDFNDFPLLKSNNQQLVEDAVRDGLFIVESSYRLKDKKDKFYGWGDDNFFGKSRSIGVKVVGGFILSDMAVHPWNGDARYSDYRTNYEYTPVVSKSEARPVGDSVAFGLPYADLDMKPIADGQFVRVNDDSVFIGQGFDIDDSLSLDRGWIVWVVADDSGDCSLIVTRRDSKVESRLSTARVEPPSTQKTVMGGVFLVTKTSGIGQLTFLLKGLLVPKDDKWAIASIGVREDGRTDAVEDKTVKTGSHGLKLI